MNETTLQKLFGAVEKIVDSDAELPPEGKEAILTAAHVVLDLLRDIGRIADAAEKIAAKS